MSRIVWLASYPKSGNTWMRVFLANFLSGCEKPAEINDLALGAAAASRANFDERLTVSSSDMTEHEIESHRPEVYRRMTSSGSDRLYLKVHDAFTHTQTGEPLFSPEVSFRAVYLVRNPLDVAISFAHHLCRSLDETIDYMASPDATLAGHRCRLTAQLPQRLLSWKEHATSWLDQTLIPVHLMRYEDMHNSPIETFGAALKFLNFEPTSERVARAVQQCSFSVLQRQEQEHGFRERPSRAKSFFRSGQVGEGKRCLTESQAGRILDTHAPVMRRLGYNTPELQVAETS